MITSHTRTYEFDEDNCYITSDLTFDLDYETVPAEPYSWGEGRGVEAMADATIITATIGRKLATRNELIDVVGIHAVEDCERLLVEETLEKEGYAL